MVRELTRAELSLRAERAEAQMRHARCPVRARTAPSTAIGYNRVATAGRKSLIGSRRTMAVTPVNHLCTASVATPRATFVVICRRFESLERYLRSPRQDSPEFLISAA